MSELQLWHGRSTVELKNIDSEDQDITKICSVNNNIFLLTSKGNVYHGLLSDQESDLCIEFQKHEFDIVDLECSPRQLYFINRSGKTLACTPDILCNANKNLLELKSGDHNEIRTISGEDLNARSLSVGARGIAYIDEAGHLWASGWQRQLGIDDVHFDSKPTLITEFSERHIIDVSLGADFGLLLVQPNETSDGGITPNPTNAANIPEQASTASQHIQSVFAATEYLKQHLSWVSGDVVGFVRNVGDLVPYRTRRDSTESESFEELALEDSTSERKSLSRRPDEDCSFAEEVHASDSFTGGEGKQQTSCSITLSSSYDFGKISSCSTLSSHGSDTEISQSLLRSRSSPMRSETNISAKTGSSSTLSSSQGSEGERAWALSRAGLALLETEVWSWGDAKCGQLGLGDMVKRDKPSVINRLRKCGVRKIACGAYHATALLLDGRVFIWGDRKTSGGTSTSPETAPKLLEMPNKLRAHDIAANNDVSYILAGMGQVFMLGRHSCYPEGIVELVWPVRENSLQHGAYRLLSSAQLCCCVASRSHWFTENRLQKLTKEQQLLEDMIEVRRLLVQTVSHSGVEVQVLLRCHHALMGATALHVAALIQTPSPIRPHSEMLILFHQFLFALCDAIACGALHQTVYTDHDKKAAVLATLCRPLDYISWFAEEAKEDLGGASCEQVKAWKKLIAESRMQLQIAEQTKDFWDSLTSRFTLKERLQEGSRHRRLVRDSRTHPLTLVGAGRFSGPHWFLLMTDCFAHIAGSQVDIHDLKTLWVDPIPDTQNLQNAILLSLPEASLTVRCQTARDRAEWLGALQTTVKQAVGKPHLPVPPSTRTARYTYTKHVNFKGATYHGRWVQGVPEGPGRLEWPIGRVYEGNFHAGHMQGHGRQTYQDGRSYEGQWSESLQSGYGVEKSAAGDVYEGYFLRGLPHGHGVCKEGGFLSSAASVYVGEWASGRRHGYGVSDEISTGEKYLGLWSNDMKHGCGMVVTLDGIYYEGNFTNGTLTGKGVMVWEDGSFYEGEFGAAGVFAGKGRLLLSSGDQFEGTLHGAWNEGVKIAGTFNKSMSPPPTQTPPKPGLFGRLSVLAAEKWRPVFRECLRQLGIPGGEETGWEPGGLNTARAWEGIAVALSQKQGSSGGSSNLDTIPQYGRVTLDAETYHLIKIYLTKAFEERAHPLGLLMHQLSGAYTTTYGGVRVHPVLLAPAVAELISLSTRLYQMVRLLFPALPPPGHEAPLPPRPSPSMPEISKHEKQHTTRPRAHSDTQGDMCVSPEPGEAVPLQEMSTSGTRKLSVSDAEGLAEAVHELQMSEPLHSAAQLSRRSSTLSNISEGELEDSEVASAAGLLLPLLLPRVHSALFVLYALHNKSQDDEYWRKLLKWNKQRNISLMAFLGIERRFWPGEETEASNCDQHMFGEAVETLQQLKTTFAPLEKLMVIRTTFQHMTKAVQRRVGSDFLWTMDALLPVFQFVVIRAQILQLGSEIHFVEDFMEPHLLNGELGIMFTTLKACYYQILQERIN